MSQPAAGVARLEQTEVTAKTVWPTIGAVAAGRLVGRLAGVRAGWGGFFTLGKLLAVATLPVTLAVYARQLMPRVCRRYTLTDRRIIILKGLTAVEEKSIDLDGFDAIDVEILPGQEWLHAGELIFRREGTEVFRLSGVSRPDVFRQVCLGARTALLSARRVFEEQQSMGEAAAP